MLKRSAYSGRIWSKSTMSTLVGGDTSTASALADAPEDATAPATSAEAVASATKCVRVEPIMASLPRGSGRSLSRYGVRHKTYPGSRNPFPLCRSGADEDKLGALCRTAGDR